jgi:hypothetical protein
MKKTGNVSLSKGQILSLRVILDGWQDAIGPAGRRAYKEEMGHLPGIENELGRALAAIDAETDGRDKAEYIVDTLEAAYRCAKGDLEGVVPFPSLAAKQPYLVNLWRLQVDVRKSTGLKVTASHMEAAILLLAEKHGMTVMSEFNAADKSLLFRGEAVTAIRFSPKV